MRRSFPVLAGLLLVSCTYGPSLEDGQIACGSAGCPDGMVCAEDGFCYQDPPPGSDSGTTPFALAIANSGAPDRIVGLCGGGLDSIWQSPDAADSTSATFADLDGDSSPEVLFGDSGGIFGVFALDGEVRPLGAPRAPGTAVAATDIDFDNSAEIIVGGDGDLVQTLKWNALDSAFATLASSPNAITAVSSVSVTPDDRGDEFTLAVGVNSGLNVVFEVSAAEGITEDWVAPEPDPTTSVAQADLDGDDEPDLAVGNFGQPSKVYRQSGRNNGGPDYELVWTSPQVEPTAAVVWGDIDGDGDPDLAIGNDGAPNRVYRNVSGQLTEIWSSVESDPTRSLAWIDHDGDGDLDLAVGNFGAPIRVYRNDGDTFVLDWSAPIAETTRAVAWSILPAGLPCP